ncbi:MAG: Asp-tRNA(Asn)/Glu-tRNA(Gln) amidotransferase GatCAB subunit B, partial [Patescibacteria group bacterium]
KEYELKDADAAFYSENPMIADYFESVVKKSGNIALSNSFVSTILVAHLNEKNSSISESPISAEHLAKLLKLIDEGVISNTTAKSTVFEAMWETKKDPEILVEELGLKQVSDSSFIENICKDALAANPQSVEDYKAGKKQALGALIGYVMKKSEGKANPKMVNDILLKILL